MQCSKFSVLTSLSAMSVIMHGNLELNHDEEEMASTYIFDLIFLGRALNMLLFVLLPIPAFL